MNEDNNLKIYKYFNSVNGSKIKDNVILLQIVSPSTGSFTKDIKEDRTTFFYKRYKDITCDSEYCDPSEHLLKYLQRSTIN
ncbi:hypothetical protein Avbf_04808 [Armadillidium vulgare]|nr:hypothetical protein Avbf_04808 [Armadillidium vulgare]